MAELVPGTLEMLILSTLLRGRMHGYGIAQRIHNASDDVRRVEEGSLYPALQRLLRKGWVTATWGTTGLNRRARFYTLTRDGRKQLGSEMEEFRAMTRAIERVLEPEGSTVPELWRRIDAWLRRRSLDRDLDEELRFHIDMKTRELGDRTAATHALGGALLVR